MGALGIAALHDPVPARRLHRPVKDLAAQGRTTAARAYSAFAKFVRRPAEPAAYGLFAGAARAYIEENEAQNLR